MKQLSILIYPALILALLRSACSPADTPDPQINAKPNGLLIMCDDLNGYSGALGGHPRVKSPDIGRLAASGVAFTNAHSNTPACSPSRNSLFTGIYAHRSKDFGWTPHDQQPGLKNNKVLTEYLRENG